MNIGIDIRCLKDQHRTGVGEYTYALLLAIFNHDSKNNYYLFSSGWTKYCGPKFNFPNVHYVSLRFPNKLLNASLFFLNAPKIDRLICRRAGLAKLDLFFAPNSNYTAIRRETPYLLTVHDMSLQHFPYLYTIKQRCLADKRQLRRAARVITPSENTRRDLAENGRPKEKISVIYPGVPSHAAKECAISLPDEFILSLATIEPRKNLLAVVRGFEAYCQKFPGRKLELIFAGAPGWKNRGFFKQLRKSPVKSRIRFLSYVSPGEKQTLLKRARLLVYPSLYEGFGFPVLEALAAEVPVIASHRSSLPEAGGRAVYYVDPHRPSEICLGLARLLPDGETRQRAIVEGKKLAAEFSWEKAAKEWLAAAEASAVKAA